MYEKDIKREFEWLFLLTDGFSLEGGRWPIIRVRLYCHFQQKGEISLLSFLTEK